MPPSKPIVTFKTSPVTFIAGQDSNPMIQVGLSYTYGSTAQRWPIFRKR